MNLNVSKRRYFRLSSFVLCLFVSLSLCLFVSLSLSLQCIVLCIVCVQFAPQTIHFVTRGKSAECKVECRVCVQFAQFFCFPFYLCIVVVCARTQHVLKERANRRKLHSPHRADATFCFGSLAFCLRPGFRLLNLMLLYFVSQCVLLSVSSVTQFAMLHS